MNIDLPPMWKERLARLAGKRPMRGLMYWGIKVMVPAQRIGVAIVAIDAEERVLLLRHVFHPDVSWGLPGGWLDRDEAPGAGALRELREETGLSAVLGPPASVTYESYPPHIGIAYLAWAQPGLLRLSNEVIEARWFLMPELPQPLLPFTRRAIDAALQLNRLLPEPDGAWPAGNALRYPSGEREIELSVTE